MSSNIFEGFRRIRLILQCLWVGCMIVVGLHDVTEPPYVSVRFDTYNPNQPFYRSENDDNCSSPNASESIEYYTKNGHKVHVSLCFQAMKFDNGAMLIPYRMANIFDQFDTQPVIPDPKKDKVWGAPVYSNEVKTYTSSRKNSFKPSYEDDKWIEQKYDEKRFNNIMNVFMDVFYAASGGAFGIWLLAYAIGWIMRGFMGIPRGMDKRQSTDSTI
jgi:hypothetical protein